MQIKKSIYAKKILLAVIVVCTVVTNVNAQIKKGAIFLGGQLGVSASKANSSQPGLPSSEGKTSGFNFSPAFGKAIKENLIIGGDIVFMYNKSSDLNNTQQKINTYGIGFFVRKYKELGKGFYLFGQGRVGGFYNKQEFSTTVQPSYSYLNKGYTIRLAIYPGVAYTVSKSFQLEAGLNDLAYLEFGHGSGPNSTNSGFSAGNNLGSLSGLVVGFRFLFN